MDEVTREYVRNVSSLLLLIKQSVQICEFVWWVRASLSFIVSLQIRRQTVKLSVHGVFASTSGDK